MYHNNDLDLPAFYPKCYLTNLQTPNKLIQGELKDVSGKQKQLSTHCYKEPNKTRPSIFIQEMADVHGVS